MGKRIQTKLQRQKQANSLLKTQNQLLRKHGALQDKQIEKLQQLVEGLRLENEYLKIIIFGKKKDKNKDKSDDRKPPGYRRFFNSKKRRSKQSYQRAIPNKEEITKVEEYEIDDCPDCGEHLLDIETVIRYEEDIKLAALEKDYQVKQVIQEQIEKGYCPECKKWHSKKEIPKTVVRLGPNIRAAVGYWVHVLNLSYDQVQNQLRDFYNFDISDGEIANILRKNGEKLRPEYERLKQQIRGSPSVHLDETGWQTGKEKNFAWVMASGQSEEAVFEVGKSRGKGNAEALLGDEFSGVRVTDGYGAYKNLSGKHQLCWVHVLRRARDLSQSDELPSDKLGFCKEIYSDLCDIYEQVHQIIAKEYQQQWRREKSHTVLVAELDAVIEKIKGYELSPKKLVGLQEQLESYRTRLFTCILYEGVAPENNKAERKLRKLVLKRKNSFGTKSKLANETFSINTSVLLSLWWQHKDQFFPKISTLLK